MFKKIWAWVLRIFNKSTAIINRYIMPSVALVENIKMFIDSPAADIVSLVIPGTFDDAVVARMRQYLPTLLVSLKLVEGCKGEPNSAAILRCAMRYINSLDDTSKNIVLAGIAAKMADYLSDGKISWSEIIVLIEYTYRNYVKPKN